MVATQPKTYIALEEAPIDQQTTNLILTDGIFRLPRWNVT